MLYSAWCVVTIAVGKQEGSEGPDGHDLLVELLVGKNGLVAKAGFVGIDGGGGVVEDAGNFFVVVDAHAD